MVSPLIVFPIRVLCFECACLSICSDSDRHADTTTLGSARESGSECSPSPPKTTIDITNLRIYVGTTCLSIHYIREEPSISVTGVKPMSRQEHDRVGVSTIPSYRSQYQGAIMVPAKGTSYIVESSRQSSSWALQVVLSWPQGLRKEALPLELRDTPRVIFVGLKFPKKNPRMLLDIVIYHPDYP